MDAKETIKRALGDESDRQMTALNDLTRTLVENRAQIAAYNAAKAKIAKGRYDALIAEGFTPGDALAVLDSWMEW